MPRAGEGAVEIDDVDPLEPGVFEALGGAGRIGAVDGRLRHVALLEAHDLALFEIDGGIEDHGAHFRKLEIRVRPSVWLFSGWNCVPATLPRATAAVTGPP